MEFFDITDNDQSGTVDFEEYLRAALEVINTPEETHKHEEI